MQMRITLAIGIVCMLFGTSVLAGISSLTDTPTFNSVRYSFNKPVVERLTVDEHVYDKVIMPDAPCSGDPGEPSLPTKGAYILLPQKTKVSETIATPGEKVSLGSGYHIMPTSNPTPLSHGNPSQMPIGDEEIYKSKEPFPGKLSTEVGTYSFRGYEILVLMLHPVQYVPATGELFYYKDMTISVKTVRDGYISPLFRGLEKDKREAMKKVDNPGVADTYGKKISGTSSSNEYDLLIVTTDSLKRSFQDLEDYHTSKGVRTIITTLTDTGSSPEDIRDYIRDAYANWGINYVLIGGDDNVVPAKLLWVYGLDEDTWPYESIMPSDLYYACLDGTFNYDDDNKWGEPTDGEGGGDVDLLAEVYVGRACVGSKNEVDNFVTKTIAYMDADADDYLKKVCLAGEHLGDYGIASWGGNHLDQLIDESDADGYVTIGIPSKEYAITTLYDRDWADNRWPKSEIIDTINKGTHIIVHDGHSNYGYALKMVSEDIDAFTNSKYCFIYSSGCNAGGFDEGDCIAEYFTVKTGYGAFAVIMNARYGWFWSYRTDGDNQRFKREFWDAVFGENIPVISEANQDSKEDNLFLIERSMMRWVYYQLNLFGDPTIAFHVGHSPDKPATPSGSAKVETGITYTYATSTEDKDDDQVYYKWDWGDGTMSEWLGPYDSGETVSASYAWAEKGVYNIRVRAKDTRGAESEWSDPLRVSVPKEFTMATRNISDKLHEWLTQIFERQITSGQHPLLFFITFLFYPHTCTLT